MQIIERFGWNKAVEFLTIYNWIIDNKKTIDDLREEFDLRNEKIRKKEESEFAEYVEERRKLKDKGIDIDWCKNCDLPLLAIESTRPECETELRCPSCERSECLDLSLADYLLKLNNQLHPPEEDEKIEPGEDKAAEKIRAQRRQICKACEFLNGKRCRQCGCSVKHRTYYNILSCPVKKW